MVQIKLDNWTQTRHFRFFIFCLVITFILPHVSTTLYFSLLADDNSSCSSHITVAEESYYAGDFEKAAEFVNLCLREQSATDEHRIQAYTILTRIALAQDDAKTARKYIEIILKIDSNYEPTIEQETPKYVNLVTEIKAALSDSGTDRSGFNKWILVGAGGVATTAIILLVAAKGGSKDPENENLPEPPAFP
jgi:hypothetical protein